MLAAMHIDDESGFDPALAKLLEEVTRRIEGGEAVDVDELTARYPLWADQIRLLVPAIAGLAKISRNLDDGAAGDEPPRREWRRGRARFRRISDCA